MAQKRQKQVRNKVIVKWANSKKGKAEIEKALIRSEKSVEYLRKARRVDPETLNKPITM